MIKALVVMLAIGVAYAEMPGIWLDNVNFTPRIIQGENANEGEFPYMISLERKGSDSHACGGSILTKHWALTAAHCCAVGTTETLQVRTGTIYLSKGGTRHAIEKMIKHKDYNPGMRWRNDICLIRVKQPFVYGPQVQQITLPPQDWPVNSGDKLTISGWGYTNPNPGQQVIPDRLQKGVNFVALTNEECGKETGTDMVPGYICARGGRKGQGVCNGDSGSPLVKNKVQVGIASWVFLPCGSGHPDFYARVPHFINWIKTQLGKEASELKFLE